MLLNHQLYGKDSSTTWIHQSLCWCHGTSTTLSSNLTKSPHSSACSLSHLPLIHPSSSPSDQVLCLLMVSKSVCSRSLLEAHRSNQRTARNPQKINKHWFTEPTLSSLSMWVSLLTLCFLAETKSLSESQLLMFLKHSTILKARILCNSLLKTHSYRNFHCLEPKESTPLSI